MFVYDRRTQAIRWGNSALLALLGFASVDELKGRTPIELFVHVDDRARLRAHRDAVQAGTEVTGIEVRWMSRDGSVRYIHATSRAVLLLDGNAILVVGKDLSEQRQAAERERVLEEQLRQTQRLDSIGQLAGGVAHDFNNILAVIMSNVGLLSEELADKGMTNDEANEIMVAPERGATLTRQLLAFSRKQHRQVGHVRAQRRARPAQHDVAPDRR